jgi:23S rRNA (adenine-N6)-dimethyltransferase
VAGSRRSWGWHQLDHTWARRIVAASGVGPGDLVLDVGAGRGALTRPLLEAGARVVAIETHPERARHLRTAFGSEIILVQADAADLWLPKRPFHVVANPPFAITTPLLTRLLHPGSRLVSARLVLQDAPARRWAAADPRWTATLDPKLPRKAFHPPPKVDCRVLNLTRH